MQRRDAGGEREDAGKMIFPVSSPVVWSAAALSIILMSDGV